METSPRSHDLRPCRSQRLLLSDIGATLSCPARTCGRTKAGLDLPRLTVALLATSAHAPRRRRVGPIVARARELNVRKLQARHDPLRIELERHLLASLRLALLAKPGVRPLAPQLIPEIRRADRRGWHGLRGEPATSSGASLSTARHLIADLPVALGRAAQAPRACEPRCRAVDDAAIDAGAFAISAAVAPGLAVTKPVIACRFEPRRSRAARAAPSAPRWAWLPRA